jgi:hypothetical protein
MTGPYDTFDKALGTPMASDDYDFSYATRLNTNTYRLDFDGYHLDQAPPAPLYHGTPTTDKVDYDSSPATTPSPPTQHLPGSGAKMVKAKTINANLYEWDEIPLGFSY